MAGIENENINISVREDEVMLNEIKMNNEKLKEKKATIKFNIDQQIKEKELLEKFRKIDNEKNYFYYNFIIFFGFNIINYSFIYNWTRNE